MIGGDWYDAMQLPDGSALLTVGDLTGHGVAATSGMAMLLGATSGAVYGQATEQLLPGDLLVLYTDGIAPRPASLADAVGTSEGDVPRLLGIGARFAACRSAQDCMRVIVKELGTPEREQDACLLIARVS